MTHRVSRLAPLCLISLLTVGTAQADEVQVAVAVDVAQRDGALASPGGITQN